MFNIFCQSAEKIYYPSRIYPCLYLYCFLLRLINNILSLETGFVFEDLYDLLIDLIENHVNSSLSRFIPDPKLLHFIIIFLKTSSTLNLDFYIHMYF